MKETRTALQDAVAKSSASKCRATPLHFWAPMLHLGFRWLEPYDAVHAGAQDTGRSMGTESLQKSFRFRDR